MNPWLSIGFILLIFGAILASVTWFQNRGRLHPEASRKMVHCVMGIVALSFPWLLQTNVERIALAVLAIAILILVSRCHALRLRMGNAVLGVGRNTYGHYFFVVSVLLLAVFHTGPLSDYVVPILLLAIADTAASLAGTFHGKTLCWGNHKTLEGSTAFFVTSFLCTSIAIGTIRGDWNQVLALSAAISLCCTILEAILTRGWDNLGVPLVALCLVREYHTFDSVSLVVATVTPLILGVLSWRWIETYLSAERSGEFSTLAIQEGAV